jgi:hypothetical protein
MGDAAHDGAGPSGALERPVVVTAEQGQVVDVSQA